MKLDPINQIGAATTKVVGDANVVFAIGRNREPNVAIGATRVVVTNQAAAIGFVDVHDRIKSRSDSSGKTFDIKHLAFLGRELVKVDIAGRFDRAVER